MKEQARHNLALLEQVRQELAAFSGTIWQSIDHDDPQALESGVALKKQYNAQLIEFNKIANEIAVLLQPLTDATGD